MRESHADQKNMQTPHRNCTSQAQCSKNIFHSGFQNKTKQLYSCHSETSEEIGELEPVLESGPASTPSFSFVLKEDHSV